ncbi:hypothetical protein SLA2020_271400 [Shorea laevis]
MSYDSFCSVQEVRGAWVLSFGFHECDAFDKASSRVSWSFPPNHEEIDLSESINDLTKAKPLHAHAKLHLATKLFPTYLWR